MDTHTHNTPSGGKPARKNIVNVASKLTAAPKVRKWPYWIGLVDDCPFDHFTIAGQCFEKQTGREVATPFRDQKALSFSVGQIVMLSEKQIAKLADALPREIFRFYKGTIDLGVDDDGNKITRRRAQHIRIMRPDDIKTREKHGYPVDHYEYREGDEPVANYAYAVMLDPQNPMRGISIPTVLSETGLELPADVKV